MYGGLYELVGFLIGLEDETWVQLWAGVFGAIPAAVISAAVAALVAVTVLNRSNAHQRVLAADGIAQQKELAAQQLAEQRDEARRVRERTVMADLLGAASGFRRASEISVEAVDTQLLEFQTAAYRWELEAPDADRPMELWQWGLVLWKPAFGIAAAVGAPRSTRSEWVTFLGDVHGSMTGIGITLGEAEPDERPEFMVFVEGRRKELNARWDDELSKLPRGAGGSSGT